MIWARNESAYYSGSAFRDSSMGDTAHRIIIRPVSHETKTEYLELTYDERRPLTVD